MTPFATKFLYIIGKKRKELILMLFLFFFLSSLEVFTNYKDKLTEKGFAPVFECVKEACGESFKVLKYKWSNNATMLVSDKADDQQKFLSQAGVCSRRTAEEWMAAGRVKVNGAVCTELGAKVEPEKDRVEVDGKIIKIKESFIYILMNKPPGYITSLEDPEGRPVVTDLLPANMPRLWPVGQFRWSNHVELVAEFGR